MTATMVRLGLETRQVQGERIRRARLWVSLTQKELASEVSWLTDTPISHNIISQIESGNRDATSREMMAIAYITGQSREWLDGLDAAFNDAVTTANLNLVIPGYDKRHWGELVNHWNDSESDVIDLVS